jgi:3-dehydroquinate dehydratase/shikimate dehydrogenase
MTYVCVPIFLKSTEQARADMARAAELGADLIELRVDLAADTESVLALVRQCPRPCVVTRRRTEEGGQCADGDADRTAFASAIATSGQAAYVDVELATLSAVDHTPLATTARQSRAGLIVSFHDFAGRPAKLHQVLTDLHAQPAEVSKLVITARTIRDNAETFELLQSAPRPMIALAMGEAGLLSRVLAGKFGAFLTFASLDGGSATAPGQVTVADLLSLYRFRSITPGTRVYGVVGSPVAHSMSPAIHNAAFGHIGWDGVYLPMLVEPGYECFKAFMETYLHLPGMNLAGLSVTIPHKENALRYVLEKGGTVDTLARSIGAINTIDIRPDAPVPLKGFSTDYAAILDTVCAAGGISRDQLKGRRVAILGAGGTGRTAVAAFAHYGATVVVYNRTAGRAEALAAEFDGKSGKVVSADWSKLALCCCEIIVNTTSVGMHPHVHQSPLDGQALTLTPEHLVFDAIYNPIDTKLLKDARTAGAKVATGVDMFLRQAVGQFECWTGQLAPVERMRHVVMNRLTAH